MFPVGLSAETEISLSLNGSEPLEDTGQTLASCGIVSGDLIRVALTADAPVRPDDGGGHAEEPGVAMETNQVSQEGRTPDV